MPRPDLPLDGKLARMLQRLGAEAEGSPYWVYAIRDPFTGDRRDWTTGDPFYVGQTNDPVRRAKEHVVAAGSTEGEARLEHRERIQAILQQGRVPVFGLLEPARTRLAALAAETRWVRRLRREGFEILTCWGEHLRDEDGEAAFGDTGVPVSRVWSLTLAEAAEGGVGVGIGCDACGMEMDLPLDLLMQRSKPTTRLSAVRDVLNCPNCGRGHALQIAPPKLSRDVEADTPRTGQDEGGADRGS